MVKLKKYMDKEIVTSKQIMRVPLTRRCVRPSRAWADIAMRVLAIFMILIMMPARAVAQEEEYLQSLIKRFPFYNTSHGIFAPVYPALARQLVEDYGITKGVAVDLGGADGSLAIELAKITELTVYNIDINPVATRLCNLLADQNQLTKRVRAIEGDATNLPLRDNFADLVVSRNSLFSWPDKMAGFREAYRILKPGGVAYMGGGFSRRLDEETLKKLVATGNKKNNHTDMPKDLPEQLRAFGITEARVIEGPSRYNWWLEMRKPAETK